MAIENFHLLQHDYNRCCMYHPFPYKCYYNPETRGWSELLICFYKVTLLPPDQVLGRK